MTESGTIEMNFGWSIGMNASRVIPISWSKKYHANYRK